MERLICLIAILSLFASCATQMITRSPEEVKMMTTQQYENANKELVLRSAISLLQSESFLIQDIQDINENMGLIIASRRFENKNAERQRSWRGTSNDASTMKVSFYIEEYNPEHTEVVLTIYEGYESTSTNYNYIHVGTGVGFYGSPNKQVNERMVYDAEVYNNWFDKLLEEMIRRAALIQ